MLPVKSSVTARLWPKVTVYVPSHDYGRYLQQCLSSLARQTFLNWDAIIIDDASVDDTAAIATAFSESLPGQVQVIRNSEQKGLRVAANTALEAARGEYLMRLDADDWLDENALLVLSNFLDLHPEVGLVYPNWTFVDEGGGIIGQDIRARLSVNGQLPDLPAHGACTMVRRRVLKAIGGYDFDVDAQDGHELWLKTLYRHGVANVETHLFFYRQHSDSLSRDEDRLLASRREIKRRAAAAGRGPVAPRVVVIVPVKNTYAHFNNLALAPLAGLPLLDYTLNTVAVDRRFATVLVATDDPAVVHHCVQRGDVRAYLRDAALSDPINGIPDVIADALRYLMVHMGMDPDILVVLSAHTPLRRTEHIQEAIDTLLLYSVDQVVSTWEDRDLHYRHGAQGMQAVNAGQISDTRYEREALYACNGSIHVLWKESVSPERFLKGRIGHIVMTRTESLVAKKPEERRLLELLLAAGTVEAPSLGPHL